VREFVKQLKLKNIILCGHSLGGAIVFSYYLHYPNEPKGLILCGTGARLRVHPAILDNLKNNFQEYLDSIQIAAFYRKTNEKVIKKHVKKTSQVDPEVIYQDFKICDGFDIMDKVEEIDIPSLIIVGNADKLTPVKYGKYLEEKIENSHLNIIEDAGHQVMLEKPEEVNKSITNFLENFF
jgi:pimeloyl-ACP methyl ester carboxylesterase